MEFMSIDLKPSECILLYLGCSLFFSDGVDRLPHLFSFFFFFFFYYFFFTNKRSITVTCSSQKQRQFNGKGIFIMSIDITI